MELNRVQAWEEFEALMPEGSELDGGFEYDWVERVLEEAEEQVRNGVRAEVVAHCALWTANVHEFVAKSVTMKAIMGDEAILMARQALEDAHFNLASGKTEEQVAYDNHVVANSFLVTFGQLLEQTDAKPMEDAA